MLTFRDTIKKISPPWLSRWWAEKFMYTVGVHLDFLIDAIECGLEASQPSPLYPDCLGHIAMNRQITRGASESDAAFAERLRLAWDSHGLAGNPYVLMDALSAFLSPREFKTRIVSDGGHWYTRNVDGSREWHAATWDWDGGEGVSRFWVVLYPPSGVWTSDGTFGDPGDWTNPLGETFGSAATYTEAQSIRALVAQLRPSHSYCQSIIVAFDADAFDPESTPAPDGHWKLWSHRVGYRSTDTLYWQGA